MLPIRRNADNYVDTFVSDKPPVKSYRGDSRAPNEIFGPLGKGFVAKTSFKKESFRASDLIKYVEDPAAAKSEGVDVFVSTSIDKDVGKRFAMNFDSKDKFIYKIAMSKMNNIVDVNEVYQCVGLLNSNQEEVEMAALGSIPANRILKAKNLEAKIIVINKDCEYVDSNPSDSDGDYSTD